MKLIVGLGNTGDKYKNTKHNVGFEVIDKLTSELKVNFSNNKKLLGEVAKHNNVIFLKPTTFMNLSGDSIIKVMNYYNINKDDIIVVFDDIDLPIGKVRIRPKGGSGGHNGIKSIISHIGEEFSRVKVGVGRKDNVDAAHYVLSKFSKEDRKIIDLTISKCMDICIDFIENNDTLSLMNKYN